MFHPAPLPPRNTAASCPTSPTLSRVCPPDLMHRHREITITSNIRNTTNINRQSTGSSRQSTMRKGGIRCSLSLRPTRQGHRRSGMAANSPCDKEGRCSSCREDFRISLLESHPWQHDSDLAGPAAAAAVVGRGVRLRVRHRRGSMDRLLEAGLRGRQTHTGRRREVTLPVPRCRGTMLAAASPPRARDTRDTILLEADSTTGRDPWKWTGRTNTVTPETNIKTNHPGARLRGRATEATMRLEAESTTDRQEARRPALPPTSASTPPIPPTGAGAMGHGTDSTTAASRSPEHMWAKPNTSPHSARRTGRGTRRPLADSAPPRHPNPHGPPRPSEPSWRSSGHQGEPALRRRRCRQMVGGPPRWTASRITAGHTRH